MFCFRNREESLTQPLFKNKRCVFCLYSIDNVFVSVKYNGDVFLLNDKKYKMNCSCRPVAHEYCMRPWLSECAHCPECSIVLSETVIENKKNYCVVVLFFLAVISVAGIVVAVSFYFTHSTIGLTHL
jgi:hypothetical protein